MVSQGPNPCVQEDQAKTVQRPEDTMSTHRVWQGHSGLNADVQAQSWGAQSLIRPTDQPHANHLAHKVKRSHTAH